MYIGYPSCTYLYRCCRTDANGLSGRRDEYDAAAAAAEIRSYYCHFVIVIILLYRHASTHIPTRYRTAVRRDAQRTHASQTKKYIHLYIIILYIGRYTWELVLFAGGAHRQSYDVRFYCA